MASSNSLSFRSLSSFLSSSKGICFPNLSSRFLIVSLSRTILFLWLLEILDVKRSMSKVFVSGS